jgi:CheY-like chemotaxis protein
LNYLPIKRSSIETMIPRRSRDGLGGQARPGLSVTAFRSIIENMKLLVVDDHPVLRGGLSALLQQIEKDVVVLQAESAEEGLALVAQNPDLDIVILDIAMPGMDGLHAIAEFGRLRPELPVIVLSSSESPKDVARRSRRAPWVISRNLPISTRYSPRSESS